MAGNRPSNQHRSLPREGEVQGACGRPLGSPETRRGRALPFGRVVKPHGLKGWLKVKPYRPDTDGLVRVRTVVLRDEETERTLEVRSVRRDRLGFLLAVGGCATRTEAEAFRGAEVALPRHELEPLEPDEFYVEDCVGLDAFDPEGRWLGVVARVEATRAHELLAVRDSRREVLVPVVEGFVLEMDEEAGRLVLDLPPGLPEIPLIDGQDG